MTIVSIENIVFRIGSLALTPDQPNHAESALRMPPMLFIVIYNGFHRNFPMERPKWKMLSRPYTQQLKNRKFLRLSLTKKNFSDYR